MKKLWIAAVLLLAAGILLISLREPMTALISAAPTAYGPVILLDAGHGGVDGGSVSDSGVVEKDINLQIALKLRVYLQAFGFQVRMTRETDCSIHDDGADTIRRKKVSDIKNRLKLLEKTDSAFLVSIHQNKFPQSKYCGTQVFYGGSNPESEVLADSIQSAVRNLLQPENSREIKRSTKDIYILYHAQKPAVMVECGFLSNGEELRRLQDETYQNQICLAILRGILEYETIEKGKDAAGS